MTPEQAIATANFELIHATYFVHVGRAADYDLDEMNDDETKPPFVLMFQRADKANRETSFLVSCMGDMHDIDLVTLAAWIAKQKKPR